MTHTALISDLITHLAEAKERFGDLRVVVPGPDEYGGHVFPECRVEPCQIKTGPRVYVRFEAYTDGTRRKPNAVELML